MQIVSLGWLALELTGSPAAVGAVTAARTLPILLLALPAGVVGDRVDRRRLIVATSAMGAAVATGLAVLAGSERLDLTALLILSALAGAANAIEVPTYNAYLGQLAGPSVLPAIAVNAFVFNAARIVGPSIAGLLLATSGAGVVFVLNAASYVALAVLLATLRPAEGPEVRRGTGGVLAAVAHVRSDPRLSIVLALLAVHTMTMSIPVILAAPVAVSLGGGAAGTGGLVAAAGLGAVVAMSVIARSARRPGRGWLVGAGLVGVGGQIGLAVVDSLAAGALAMAVAGGGMVAYTALSNAAIQLIGPEGGRGLSYVLLRDCDRGIGAFAAWLLGGASWPLTLGLATTWWWRG